jgi:hypothetical protein
MKYDRECNRNARDVRENQEMKEMAECKIM